MPEIISKHPNVVRQVLESGGAKCGQGLPQKILKQCPRESFCSLPGGEICIYGVDEIDEMTQLSRSEICTLPETNPPLVSTGAADWLIVASVGAALAAGRLHRRRRTGQK